MHTHTQLHIQSIYTFMEHTHAQACTFTQTHMHLDGCHMLKVVGESVCLCSWDWSASGMTVCLFDHYLVVLTLSCALKVLPFCCLSGHWYWCQGDRLWKSNFLSLWGLDLDSEYDLRIQSWCFLVHEEAYLELDPRALKHTEIFCRQEFQLVPWFSGDKLSTTVSRYSTMQW